MNSLDLIYIVVGVLTCPIWARKTRGGWAERLGRAQPVPRSERKRVLVHAVSVGEVNALRSLVPLLNERADVVVSVTTDTGLARARALFAETCHVVRFPLDFSWGVRRLLDAAVPDAVGLVELELWPNFLRACRRRRIPVCVINGRLSERSFARYRRFRFVTGRMFRALGAAAVQDAAHAGRFAAMGAAPVLVTGSMKWDSAQISDHVAGADDLAKAMGIDRSRPLIVAGSTGPGEEELLHAACPDGVQLLCAPRKPERFDEAATALPGCVRRSARGAAPGGTERFLLDTIGELRQAYVLADVAVVGRSFGDLYGSDPIEPVALGRATVIGPAVSDFRVIVDALRDAEAIVQTDRAGLADTLGGLVADPERRRRLAENGRACICRHQGASRRHAELLLDMAGLDRASAT